MDGPDRWSLVATVLLYAYSSCVLIPHPHPMHTIRIQTVPFEYSHVNLYHAPPANQNGQGCREG